MLIAKANPSWPDVFKGFVPSKTLIDPGALYTGNRSLRYLLCNCIAKTPSAIGIIGATVMPHALFLGSSLATLDRVSRAPTLLPRPSTSQTSILDSVIGYMHSVIYFRWHAGDEDGPDRRTRHAYRENNSISFVCSHLRHGIVDIGKYRFVGLDKANFFVIQS